LNDALAQYGKPETFNTDQGSQFTSFDFTGALKDSQGAATVLMSQDGR
jgi:putative transposase